jgi:hypothetical protein
MVAAGHPVDLPAHPVAVALAVVDRTVDPHIHPAAGHRTRAGHPGRPARHIRPVAVVEVPIQEGLPPPGLPLLLLLLALLPRPAEGPNRERFREQDSNRRFRLFESLA